MTQQEIIKKESGSTLISSFTYYLKYLYITSTKKYCINNNNNKLRNNIICYFREKNVILLFKYMDNLNFTTVSIPMSMQTVSNIKRMNCWESDFGKEFPISCIQSNEGETTVITGYPHSDYRIITNMKNQKMDGESTLFTESEVRIAKLTFVEGIANGPCTIYHDNGMLFFEGKFVNGYREGPGKEYDEKGNLIYDGLYDKGKKMEIVSSTCGYLEKTDEPKANVQIVNQLNNENENNGVKVQLDDNGEIIRLFEWKEGEEIPFTGYYKFYNEKYKKWVEGEYKNGVRNGASKEYEENGNLIFDGYFENGKKSNLVRLPEMNGYWKEYDDKGNLKCICKKDKYGQYEGVCYFYENGKLQKISEWKQGKEISKSGYYKFYDDLKGIWYEGRYQNGIPEGISKEYSRNGSILFEGYKINGNKLTPMDGNKLFWKEVDNDNNLVRICEINDDGQYDGISYFYQNGEIYRVSKWKNGKETEVLKMFSGSKMNEYKKGKLWYSGEYVKNDEYNYIREGKGEEYDTDGVTLIYKGSIKNGKRNGHGKEYHNGNVVYDGEWIKGMKKMHYYLWMILIFVFMFVSAAVCFYKLNAYVGAVVSGIYITMISFYYSRYAGTVSLILFFDLICFMIHLYVGLIVLLVIIVTYLSFWDNVLTGIIPLGLAITLFSYSINIFAGISMSGVFLIYILFWIVHKRNWKMSVLSTGAGVILGICIITSLSIGLNINQFIKYLLIIAIGLFIIYIILLIILFFDLDLSIFIPISGAILISCLISSLIIGVENMQSLKYVLIFLFGLLMVFTIYELVVCCDWKMNVVYSSAGVILGICIITSLSIGFHDNSKREMLYILIFTIGIFIEYIIFLIVHYSENSMKLVFANGFLILCTCCAVCLLLIVKEIPIMKYVLILLSGLIMIFLVLVLSDCYNWETNVEYSSIGVIFGLCSIACLLIGLNQNEIMKYLLVFAIGLFLVYIVFLIVHQCNWNLHAFFSSTGIIMISCMITSLFIGGKNMDS